MTDVDVNEKESADLTATDHGRWWKDVDLEPLRPAGEGWESRGGVISTEDGRLLAKIRDLGPSDAALLRMIADEIVGASGAATLSLETVSWPDENGWERNAATGWRTLVLHWCKRGESERVEVGSRTDD